ncbi:MAG: translation initiation factor IF-2 [Alphaproteobacteria bacterium]|nr:translation initiation factor IF-2 [Alphaproteobacteria bacterium]
MTGTTDKNEEKVGKSEEKKTLTLTKKVDTRPVVERDQVRQRFAHGRSKTVEVEVRRKRTASQDRHKDDPMASAAASRGLTGNEFDVRMRVLRESMIRQNEEDTQKKINDAKTAMEAAASKAAEAERAREIAENPELAPVETTVAETPSPTIEQSSSSSTPAATSHTSRPAPAHTDTRNNSYTNPRNRSDSNASSSPRHSDRPYNSDRPTGGRSDGQRPYAERRPGTDNRTDGAGARPPYQPRSADPKKKPLSKDDIQPIIFRAEGYAPKPRPGAPAQVKGAPATQVPLVIDPILEKNRADHRAIPAKPRHKADEEDTNTSSINKADPKKAIVRTRTGQTQEAPRKLNRNVLTRVLDGDSEKRGRSLASVKRARQKHFKQSHDDQGDAGKIVREVIIPESMTVGELANRMAVRGADVVKSLMKLGMMVTINQVIDADTAELICGEFGHTPKRVADSDIEIGLGGASADQTQDLLPRAPVVTVMGHVDHGKTSLLDALRETDVVAGEAGGITQHIGAYQVTMQSGKKITFIDTPGHAAFSEMRARGANATDIVVLVVAADDGIMEQTIEAINHAKAANVPIVVAINKMDKPDANSSRVRQELLQHGILLEEFGGEVIAVDVSAKKRMNLEKLEESILLQAEILELKANPNRSAQGVIIEAEIDKGRGTIATVLVQRGTLKMGDIFVAGQEWGRVKALVNDHGKKINTALPAMPVEVLGFNGVPAAGDEFFVVESEQKAREITEYRQRRHREKQVIVKTKGGMESIMSRIANGEIREMPVVIKADVQGSLEAIIASLGKLGNEEVSTRILHGAVGGINESDITLAKASGGIIIGFNVRANPQARDLARRDGVKIRYYSIIYDMLDEVRALLSGLLAPTLREKYQGTAEIRSVFMISKVGGKVAGCYVTEGTVKRGAKVRILRDSVVIHEGDLKSLKRFKDEVKEVKEAFECGMVFENFADIREGDMVECFEIESIARQL